MFSEKTFRICFIISLFLHVSIFLKLPHINLLPVRHTIKRTELTYIKERITPPSLKLYNQRDLKKDALYQAPAKKIAPPPYVKKEQIFNKIKSVQIKKPEFNRPEIIAVKKKITLPSLTNEKMASPVYLNYYQIIREKIKHAAYQNYTSSINGEVYLSFIILKNGQLKDVKIHEEKSSMHAYLKRIAGKSIRDASPFPSFPKELDYPELSFNVIISFEVE